MADTTGWLPNLLGPINLLISGVLQSVPKRLSINLIGIGLSIGVADNSAQDRTDITFTAAPKASVAMPALAVDWSAGDVFTKTLAAGANAITFSNSADGQSVVVILTGAASTVSWPTVKWAGGTPPTQTASGTDVYTFVKTGTTIYGSVVQDMS